jgi:hypothetical protein
MASRRPETRYAASGDVSIAYQVSGDGEFDLAIFPASVTNVEIAWEGEHSARHFDRLGAFSRLILFDKRGRGFRIGSPALRTSRRGWTMFARCWMPLGRSGRRFSVPRRAARSPSCLRRPIRSAPRRSFSMGRRRASRVGRAIRGGRHASSVSSNSTTRCVAGAQPSSRPRCSVLSSQTKSCWSSLPGGCVKVRARVR